eukprot:Platyproteum_vivax@DN3025_c0_g1_i1.p1
MRNSKDASTQASMPVEEAEQRLYELTINKQKLESCRMDLLRKQHCMMDPERDRRESTDSCESLSDEDSKINTTAAQLLDRNSQDFVDELALADQDISEANQRLQEFFYFLRIELLWDREGNIKKMSFNGDWCSLTDFRYIKLSAVKTMLIKYAMCACRSWEKNLLFRATKIDKDCACDIADIINCHPNGFEKITFADEINFGNSGLRSVVDRLDDTCLERLLDLTISECNLTGVDGGHAIHDLLDKCGSYLRVLGLQNNLLGYDGIRAAFAPFEDRTRVIKIGCLDITHCGAVDGYVPRRLRNCAVKLICVFP